MEENLSLAIIAQTASFKDRRIAYLWHRSLAGKPLGLKFIFLDPTPIACAADLGKHLTGDYTDKALLTQLAEESDIITCLSPAKKFSR
jgi:Na+-transporting NADH:ubiquinone oxidoreductase subunit NqrB